MKRELSFVQMGLSVVSMVFWFLLPVVSFIIVIPLFNITGWSLAMRINQLTLFVLFGSLLMLLGAIINNRKLMIVSASLEIVFVIVLFIFRKEMLLNGNFKWIYNSATLLVQKVPEVIGIDTSSWNIQEVIKYVVDNFLQIGAGSIIHALCTLAYLILAICAPNEKPIFNGGNNAGIGSGSASGGTTFNTKTTHQNTGFTHRT